MEKLTLQILQNNNNILHELHFI